MRYGLWSAGNPRNAFPLVRRSMTSASGSESVPATRALPRLMSLELFNPETDDMDSDSSGVSSPDSVGSVISVLNDDEHPAAPQGNHQFVLSRWRLTRMLLLYSSFQATPHDVKLLQYSEASLLTTQYSGHPSLIVIIQCNIPID